MWALRPFCGCPVSCGIAGDMIVNSNAARCIALQPAQPAQHLFLIGGNNAADWLATVDIFTVRSCPVLQSHAVHGSLFHASTTLCTAAVLRMPQACPRACCNDVPPLHI
jgi:hypothetical protein